MTVSQAEIGSVNLPGNRVRIRMEVSVGSSYREAMFEMLFLAVGIVQMASRQLPMLTIDRW